MRCSHCGKKIPPEGIAYELVNGECLCYDCARIVDVRRCACCGGYMINNGSSLCDTCESVVYTRAMNSYSTKPKPVFKNHYKDTSEDLKCRYYGLEMEFNDSNCETIHELCEDLYEEKWIYNKSDSSISCGVEVVTNPMDRKSIDVLLKRMQPIFNYLNDRDYEENAGLHIHVTKKSICPVDRHKICTLLNRRANTYERNIMYYLSGRIKDINKLKLEKCDDHYYRIGNSRQLSPKSTGHDVALNTYNNNTYEFRIFKSSIIPEIIKSYVEMVDKMIEFCHVNGIIDISISNFIIWLKNNTSNTILLEKINKFESNVYRFKKRPIMSNNIFECLRGVNWRDYYKVIYFIRTSGEGRASKYLFDLESTDVTPDYLDRIEKSNVNNETIQRLLKTIRMASMGYILSNQDIEGEEKCA